MTASPAPRFAHRLAGVPSSAVRDILQFALQPGVLSLAGGMPDPALLDIDGLAAATATVLRDVAPRALQYGATEGQLSLRTQLAKVMKNRGADIDVSRILVTGGSQQALDLVARTLLNPGDRVAVENPSYLAALQVFALAEVKIVPLNVDDNGACIEMLIEGCSPKPKLVYLVPTFGNPNAVVLSVERRRALLAWAAHERVYVLEDDPYSELRYDGDAVPSLLSLARDIPGAEDFVIHVATLSKVMSPGVRIGWLVAPPSLLPGYLRVKQALDLHTSTLAQEIAAQWLADDRLAPTITRLHDGYRLRRDALVSALHEEFGDHLIFAVPPGGMFVWASFRDGRDTTALLAKAIDQGVVYVPGQAFSAGPVSCRKISGAMRLGFATLAPENYALAIRRLATAVNLDLADRNQGVRNPQRQHSA